ncbi:hypothetical protein B0H11DRAFT_1946487 [Mycena galericulata]|nr:hypothetical protein B0H11DRAFT_1946487 [Mycena galericulata]
MPPQEENSPKFQFNYALIDKKHRLTHKTVHTSQALTFESLDEFNRFTIWEILLCVQTHHRKQNCALCPGPILVKSAWAVRIPAHATAEHLPDPSLEHNPAGGIKFMQPASLISEYIDINSCDANVIDVLFESTFDVQESTSNESPTKRPLELVDEPSRASGSSKRPKLEAQLPKGIRVVPPVDSASPINLPPASFILSSIVETPGTIFVDKSAYIPAFDTALSHRPGIVPLPPGTGKTGTMSVLSLWYDWSIPPQIHEKIFMSLDIGPTFKEALSKLPADSQLPYSARRHLCLVFNLGEIQFDGITDGKKISRRIDEYCCRVIQQFVQKYKDQLGFHEFSVFDLASPVNMMEKIQTVLMNQFNLDRAKQHTLFMGVDHLDAPLLQFLESVLLRGAPRISETIGLISNTLDSLLKSLWQLAGARTMQRSKLLINSNLPYHPGKQSDMKPQNISTLPILHGAFGMTSDEVARFFSVLSRPGQVLDLNTPNLPSVLGVFSPPSLSAADEPPADIYSFRMILHYVTRVLKLVNEHNDPPSWPLVSQISRSTGCKRLLEHSNLRHLRHVFLPPALEFKRANLASIHKSEEVLWTVLFSLGVLVVRDQGKDRSDALWSLRLSSPHARKQLFSDFPPLQKDELVESNRDIQIRSLLERNPTPLTDALSERLSRKHHRELHKMPEAAFQAMFEDLMETDEGTYRNNCFGQLGLLTDSTQDKLVYSDKPRVSLLPGEGRHGYADIFGCGFRVRPKRAVVVELKCLSLYGFLRARYQTDKEYRKAVHDDPKVSFRKHCKALGKYLRKLPLATLRNQNYWCYRDDKLGHILVGDILDDAERQLKCYLKAIASGIGGKGDPVEGITSAETRVKVEAGSDELIGMVICAVGPHVVTTAIVETEQTRYRYRARPGWGSLYDEKD